MKELKVRYIHIVLTMILGIAVAGGVAGCSADDSDQGQQHELSLSLNQRQYHYITRALPSDDWRAYQHATELAPITQIQGYLTWAATADPTSATENKYIPCEFNYSSDDSNWKSRVALEDGTYYLYGYMPKENVGSNVSISPLSEQNYPAGAVLTLTGLNAVSPQDICVIVGMKQYTDAVPDMSDGLGKFSYSTDGGDNLFLLIDHIYAGMQLNMRMADDEYYQLRRIKVKQISLTPYTGSSSVVETVNATVTITANDAGTDPITSVSFATATTGTSPQPAIIYSGEGKELTTENQSFLGCLCPVTAQAESKYVLETKYDVYDLKGNLIRNDETARNVITLSQKLTRGQLFTVNITVQPTYLHVLSDPDLDNPQFKVNT